MPETHAVQGVVKMFNLLEVLSYAWEMKFVFEIWETAALFVLFLSVRTEHLLLIFVSSI